MSRVSTLPAEIDASPMGDGPASAGAPVAATLPPPEAAAPPMGLGQAIAHDVVHGMPEAVSSLMRTIIVALFILTFVTQPMVIPSESMEHTLLVGDFLLMNRSELAPAGIWRRILPYGSVQRGEIVTFHSPLNAKEYLVKRVIGLPGDRLRIDGNQVWVNGQPLDEPYATFEPVAGNPYLDRFPAKVYSDPGVEPNWWKQMQQLTQNGELVIPQGDYFMMGDHRHDSLDSRYWGFVPRANIVGRPLFNYWSFKTPDDEMYKTSFSERMAWMGHVALHFFTDTRWSRTLHLIK